MRLDSGGRERSVTGGAVVAVVVVELALEICDGGRRMVAPERVVTDDLARACRGPGLGPETAVTVP